MNNQAIRQRLTDCFGPAQDGLRQAVMEAKERLVQLDRFTDGLASKLVHPLEQTAGLFHNSIDELDRAKRQRRAIDLSLIGDLCLSFEVVVRGPRCSVSRLEALAGERSSVRAEIIQVWLSLLEPVFALDSYVMQFEARTLSWTYSPLTLIQVEGCRDAKAINGALKTLGYRRLSPRFCAVRLPTLPRRPAGQDPPRVFDYLFTDLAHARLQFNSRGYHTRMMRWGVNRDPQTGMLVEGVVDKAIAGVEVSWNEHLRGDGTLERRRLIYVYPSRDRVIVEQGADGSVHSATVRRAPSLRKRR